MTITRKGNRSNRQFGRIAVAQSTLSIPEPKSAKSHKYLLMAILADLPDLYDYYLSFVSPSPDIWDIFRCMLYQRERDVRGLSWTLLAQVATRGPTFDDAFQASAVLSSYHNHLDVSQPRAIGSYERRDLPMEVCRILLEKLANLAGGRSDLRRFRSDQERAFLKTYDSVATEMTNILKRVSKTWKYRW